MYSKISQNYPQKKYIRKIKISKNFISKSSITENEWADTYVNKRNADTFRYANDLEMLRERVEKGATVFEHGAAPFVLSHALATDGYDLFAGDASPERFPGTSDMPFSVTKHDIEKDTLNRQFDVVLCNEIFEHLRLNLIDTFRNVYESLVSGGYLFLSTPNASSIKGIYNMILQDKSYAAGEGLYHEWSKLDRIGHLGHVKEYTGSEVAYFLDRVGFDIEKVVYRNPQKYVRLKKTSSKILIKKTFDYFIETFSVKFRPLFSVIARKS